MKVTQPLPAGKPRALADGERETDGVRVREGLADKTTPPLEAGRADELGERVAEGVVELGAREGAPVEHGGRERARHATGATSASTRSTTHERATATPTP